MVFKKRKKDKNIPDAENEGVIDTDINSKKKKEEVPKIPEDLQAAMDVFKERYLGMFSQTDFNQPEMQQLNLQFAIFAELRAIREILEAIEAQE